MNNKTVVAVGAGLLGLWFLSSQTSQGGAGGAGGSCTPQYTLPDGRQVCENQLPALNYVYFAGDGTKAPGWYHVSAFEPPPGSPNQGIDTSSQQWYDILVGILQVGGSIASLFKDLGNNNNTAVSGIGVISRQGAPDIFCVPTVV